MNEFGSHIELFTYKDNYTREIHYWSPNNDINAIFIGFHGGLAHPCDFAEFGNFFKQKGYLTIAPILRGHNQKRAHIDEFQYFIDDAIELIDKVKTDYPRVKIYLVGHSVGALINLYLLTQYKHINDLSGIIYSSPFLANATKVPKIVVSLSKILASLFPKAKTPVEDIRPNITQDKILAEKIYNWTEIGVRSLEISMRTARAFLDAQNYLLNNPPQIQGPKMLAIIANKDKICDPITSIDYFNSLKDTQVKIYDENYHDNFNETNRSDVFQMILDWI